MMKSKYYTRLEMFEPYLSRKTTYFQDLCKGSTGASWKDFNDIEAIATIIDAIKDDSDELESFLHDCNKVWAFLKEHNFPAL